MAARKRKRGNNKVLLASLVVLIAVGAYLIWSGDIDLSSPTPPPEGIAEAVRFEESLLPEVPEGDQLIQRYGYTLAYDEPTEQASWVAYLLTQPEVAGKVPRSDYFNEDPKVVTGSASYHDYTNSGFDRGHLAPAGDMKWSDQAMVESFFMSNVSPQNSNLNRGTWRVLEEQTRDWVRTGDNIFIVTGPVFRNGITTTIGDNEVAVPSHFFKVMVDVTGPQYKGVGFIFENAETDHGPYEYMITIDSVEAFTGLDFFPEMPDNIEYYFEGYDNFINWNYNQ